MKHTVRQVFCWIVFSTAAIHCSHVPTQPSAVNRDNATTNGAPAASNPLDEAYRYYAQGDFQKTLSLLEAFYSPNAKFDDNWGEFILCYCYLATGEYKKALRLAEKLVKEEPYQSLSYQQLGLAQLWSGQPQLAIDNFQRALEFDSHAPRTHFYFGLAQRQLKQAALVEKTFDHARAEYEQILSVNPKDFTANYELSALLLFWNHSLDKIPQLISAARNSISQSEEELTQERKLYLNYYLPTLEGILLYRKGAAKESIQALTESLSNAPAGVKADLAEIYHYLGQSYLLMGDNSNAKDFLQKAMETDPKGAYAPDTKVALQTIASRENSGP